MLAHLPNLHDTDSPTASALSIHTTPTHPPHPNPPIHTDNTLHATLSAVLLCQSTNPHPTPARASSVVAGLLGALLAPGVLPSLHTLVIDGKDLLDERGLERLGQVGR